MKAFYLDNEIIRQDMEEIYSSHIDWERLRNKSILISGANGMLASYLALFFIYLNETYHYDISLYLNIRNKNKAKARFNNYLSRKYIHLMTDDITCGISLKENINIIIHAASLASPQYYEKMPVETALPNIIGTYWLLEFARKQKNFEGFLFFSSGSIYGKPLSSDIITETTKGVLDHLDNGNAYSESKRCGEMLCHAYYSEYNVPSKSVRIFHTYSPSMDIDNDKRAFSEFIKNYINGEDIVLKSDGSSKRAFCYITDAIRALFYILFYGKNGDSYNMGNPNCFHSIYELASIISRIDSSKAINIVFADRRDDGYRLSPECDSVIIPLSIEKLNALGWSPSISSEVGFKRVVDYFSVKI